MIRILLTLSILITSIGTNAIVDLVKVDKSERRMYLMEGNKVLKEYRVRFGANPIGHKTEYGDEKTPEGRYKLDFIKEDSSFYRAMHISYPNQADKKQAAARGVLVGGDIMIHGQKNGWGWASLIIQLFNWTDGCIAIKNFQMDEFIKLVPVGTTIQIDS